MTQEEYSEWIESLKSLEVNKGNIDLLKKIFRFSPEKHAKCNGLDESFVKQFQKDRKLIHNRLIDFEKIKALRKRKVATGYFHYSGKRHTTRVCICVSRFKNEEHRAKGGYDFYEGIKYNYVIIFDEFFGREDVIIFDEKGSRIYSTIAEFNKHFIDIRERLIDDILK